MTKLMGVEFAPFYIPTERRLQTLSILYWTTSFLFKGFFGAFLSIYILLCTDYWPVSAVYFLWYWYDYKTPERGGRRSSWVRGWAMWKYMRDYFPIRLVKTAALDPNKNYVCGIHPHGIFSAGAFNSFCTDASEFSALFPNIRPNLLTLQGHFQFPFYREFVLALGSCSVTRDSIHWLLSNQGSGNMVIIVIGGAAESLDAHPGPDVRLTLRRRKGFVRMALQHGASLIPIFSFGENELFEQIPNPEGSFLRNAQNKLTKILGFAPPIILGRGVFQYSVGYLPFRKPVDVIVGKPIDVEKIEHPTDAEVERYHELYIESLTKLFDEHKVNYESYKNAKLIV